MDHLFQLPAIHDRGTYTPKRIGEMVRLAKEQGYPVGPESYLQHMSLAQLDNLLQGRTDA